MRLDAALNLIWLALGLVAFTSAFRSAYRRKKTDGVDFSWTKAFVPVLVVSTLFPFFSATDDLVRIKQTYEQQQAPSSSQSRLNDELIHLYQTIESAVQSGTPELTLTFFFLPLAAAPVFLQLDRETEIAGGRAPPACA